MDRTRRRFRRDGSMHEACGSVEWRCFDNKRLQWWYDIVGVSSQRRLAILRLWLVSIIIVVDCHLIFLLKFGDCCEN